MVVEEISSLKMAKTNSENFDQANYDGFEKYVMVLN